VTPSRTSTTPTTTYPTTSAGRWLLGSSSTGPNEMNTLDALRVLRGGGRLLWPQDRSQSSASSPPITSRAAPSASTGSQSGSPPSTDTQAANV
jgi:hypothetical protein